MSLSGDYEVAIIVGVLQSKNTLHRACGKPVESANILSKKVCIIYRFVSLHKEQP
jgi:hypothetical protein